MATRQKSTQRRRDAEERKEENRKATPIRILARTKGSDHHVAWLELDPKFKASSTCSQEAAAHNLAIRYFLGSAWRAQLPAEEINKVQVENLGGGVFVGRYAV